ATSGLHARCNGCPIMGRFSPPIALLRLPSPLTSSHASHRSKVPESNGMAEAFVKTFKRDYVRINSLPDARTVLSRIDHWMEDYNSEHPHSRLGYRSPREYIASLKPAECPV